MFPAEKEVNTSVNWVWCTLVIPALRRMENQGPKVSSLRLWNEFETSLGHVRPFGRKEKRKKKRKRASWWWCMLSILEQRQPGSTTLSSQQSLTKSTHLPPCVSWLPVRLRLRQALQRDTDCLVFSFQVWPKLEINQFSFISLFPILVRNAETPK